MMYDLPKKLQVGGRWYRIRTDFRAVLDILVAFGDPELDDAEKDQVMREILYIDYDTIPLEDWTEAAEQAVWFIDCGLHREDDMNPKPRTMDWQKDAPIVIPAVNKVAMMDVRAMKYLHWWTFFGYYMEIGEGTFSTVLGIRQKRAEGKKLEKWEEEFLRKNRSLCALPEAVTDAQKERRKTEEEALKKLFGE